VSVHDIPRLDTSREYEINAASQAFTNGADQLLSPSSPPHLYTKTFSYKSSPPISPIPSTPTISRRQTGSTQISFSEPAQTENRISSTQPQHTEKALVDESELISHSEKHELPEIQIDQPLFEDMSCLSILAKGFVAKIRELADMRELFCAIEYPESFTGSEAVVSIGMTKTAFGYIPLTTTDPTDDR
jgi:hypothetical protein